MVDGFARAAFIEADLEDELLETPVLVLDQLPPGPPSPPPPPPAPRIIDGLALTDATISEFADYSGVTFTEDVIVKDVRFTRGFSFEGATFRKRVRFENVANDRVRGSKAEFANARFHGSAFFVGTTALYLASFQGAHFAERARFQG